MAMAMSKTLLKPTVRMQPRVAAPRRAPKAARGASAVARAAPIVGNPAPGFTAQAVYDQEFMEVTLDQYKVRRLAVPAMETCPRR